jgi:hypothetical protein
MHTLISLCSNDHHEGEEKDNTYQTTIIGAKLQNQANHVLSG